MDCFSGFSEDAGEGAKWMLSNYLECLHWRNSRWIDFQKMLEDVEKLFGMFALARSHRLHKAFPTLLAVVLLDLR